MSVSLQAVRSEDLVLVERRFLKSIFCDFFQRKELSCDIGIFFTFRGMSSKKRKSSFLMNVKMNRFKVTLNFLGMRKTGKRETSHFSYET